MAYRDVVLADAPIGYWRLEEAAGTQAADLSGNARHGLYTGGVTLNQAGAPGTGRGALFDGVNDRITLPSFTVPGAFSVEAWCKIAGGVTQRCVWGNRTASLTASTYFGVADGGLYAFVYRTGATTAAHYGDAQAINDGVWHHLVYTYDGTTGRLYVDGRAPTLVTPGAIGATAVTDVSAIGQDGPTGGWFPGALDEVAVYGAVLAPVRVAAHYTAGSAPGFAGQPFAGEPFAGQPFAGEPFAGQVVAAPTHIGPVPVPPPGGYSPVRPGP